MRSSVVWSRAAQKDLRRLDAATRRRVIAAVDRFAATGEGDVKHLQGRPELRLRVGDWRVFFQQDRGEGKILILGVVNRGEAY